MAGGRIVGGNGWRQAREGFTLIELLVVLAIIATLLTVALPRYFNSVDHSREVALRQDLKTVRSAIDQFHADTGRYPADLQELVSRHYLSEVPQDPITESRESWITTAPPSGDSGGKSGGDGLYDIHSGATGTARDGSNYQDW